MTNELPNASKPEVIDSNKQMSWLAIIATVVVIALAYEKTMVHLAGRWSIEPEYSHGFFVPVFSLVLLWLRRDQVMGKPWKGSWWGLWLVGLGVAMRFVAAYDFYTLVGALALLPTLAGLAVLAGGNRALRWALPSIFFLVFMIPLPGFSSDLLAQPLQHVATTSSTYLLQIFGIPATAEGNIIVLTDGRIGVVEACSGLRMLVLFVAVSTGVAFLVRRNLWERLLLVASAVPIALAVNILRITSTAVVHELISPDAADAVFHQAGGLLMGPLALAILWLEMKFLDRALVTTQKGPLMLEARKSSGN
jgi:exosortase